ncbi:MAG: DUF2103 domain-containing protein [Bacillota bacterium]
MKKYRAGKIKREHSVIDHLWPVLERIAACEHVTSIIPGPIRPLGSQGFEVTFQRFTETGLRLLAKNGAAVQEVYIVAPDKQAALDWLAAEGIVEWKPKREGAASKKDAPEPLSTVTLPADMTCAVCGRPLRAGTRAAVLGRKRHVYAHVRCARK